MRIKQNTNRSDPDVNITPLIDVVFLLLIFFMITTTFMRESELELALPEASGEPVTRDDQPFELIVNYEGKYFIDDYEVIGKDLPSLKAALEKSIKGRENRPFVIRADGKAPHQAVITAMDAAGQLNISKIAFATVSEKSTPLEDEEARKAESE